jgi:hypothetical protein
LNLQGLANQIPKLKEYAKTRFKIAIKSLADPAGGGNRDTAPAQQLSVTSLLSTAN